MKRLGVNIDHVATIRNARGERHPDPYYAALYVIKMGADSVTIHLREDRRHINDLDAKKICKTKKVLVNLEISINDKIVNNALKIKTIITSHLKIIVPTFSEKKLPKRLKSIPITIPGSRFIK